MAYRLRPTRLVEVLLPVLAALYHETEVGAGVESLPGSYLTQIKCLAETRLVCIKAQLFLLAAELLPAEKLRRLHTYCSSLRGYDEWNEVRLQRRNALSQVALTYFTLAKLREPTELGMSRLSGFLSTARAPTGRRRYLLIPRLYFLTTYAANSKSMRKPPDSPSSARTPP